MAMCGIFILLKLAATCPKTSVNEEKGGGFQQLRRFSTPNVSEEGGEI